MNKVANAGAIGRVEVVAVDGEDGQLANRHLRHEWHQIVGHAARVFAHAAAGMCADWIEIAKKHNLPTLQTS